MKTKSNVVKRRVVAQEVVEVFAGYGVGHVYTWKEMAGCVKNLCYYSCLCALPGEDAYYGEEIDIALPLGASKEEKIALCKAAIALDYLPELEVREVEKD